MNKEHHRATIDKGSNSSDTSGISKIIAIAETNGWNVDTDEVKHGHIVFEFSQYTPAGQDFNFSAELTNGEVRTLIENIKEYYDGFDADAEAYLWIGDDGHGKNGAPYHIKDIVRDMKAAEEMVYHLYLVLNQTFD